MPYFVFKCQNNKFRSVDHIEAFESFKEAKALVKNLRAKNSLGDPLAYKVVFADDLLEAEMLILEKREAPILREWEK